MKMSIPSYNKSKKLIGRGGYGEIYYNINNPNTVYKLSHNCMNGDLNKEYNMLLKAYNTYIKYTKNKKNLRNRIHILKPSNWKQFNGNCLFKMSRIFSLSDDEFVWHPYLGGEEGFKDVLYKTDLHIRGRQIGLETISKYISLKRITRDSGILIGIVHYGAKLDAFDTELAFGIVKNYNGVKNLQLFLIDFDKVSNWDELEEDQLIENMISSLEDVPYYPGPNSKYFSNFKSGYLSVAGYYGYEKLALKVLNSMYTD